MLNTKPAAQFSVRRPGARLQRTVASHTTDLSRSDMLRTSRHDALAPEPATCSTRSTSATPTCCSLARPAPRTAPCAGVSGPRSDQVVGRTGTPTTGWSRCSPHRL